MPRKHYRVGVAALVAALSLAGCGYGSPATKDDVCSRYDALDKQLIEGNGVFGNPLFRKVEQLADTADRFQGSPDLKADAETLHDIADSDATTAAELRDATGNIADLCGHPLGTSGFFGP